MAGDMAGVELAICSVRLSSAERFDGLAMLSEAERGRYDAASPTARDGFLAGRMLLRELAGAHLDLAPAAVPLVAVCPDCGGSHGRPTVEGSGLRVSLSHAGEWVVAAAVLGRAVGIDAEVVGAPDAQRDAAIRTVAGGEGLSHWVRVEAVLKADGRGLRVDPRDVRFDGDAATVASSATLYELVEPALDPALRVAVAVERVSG